MHVKFARQAGRIFPFRWQRKVHFHKVLQIEARLGALHPIIRQNHQRIAFRHGVSKGLLIGKQFGTLHIIKERTK